MKKNLTGGELNWLNGKFGVSAPDKSVPVMKLIRTHKPKSQHELYSLIREHFVHRCDCGIISQGTVEDFGRNLYKAQFKAWGKEKYTLNECIRWEYHLFVTNSLKGELMEVKAQKLLAKTFPNLMIKRADEYVDAELRVDLTVESQDRMVLCGVQVKPESFDKMRQSVKDIHLISNAKWGRPVFNLVYDDQSVFTNLVKVTAGIDAQLA